MALLSSPQVFGLSGILKFVLRSMQETREKRRELRAEAFRLADSYYYIRAFLRMYRLAAVLLCIEHCAEYMSQVRVRMLV